MKEQNTYCDKMRQLILLEDSGELTREQATELGQHLAQCGECDSYRNDIEKIMSQSRTALPSAAPSAEAVSNILAQARPEQHKLIAFPRVWRYAAAAAAVLVLFAGTYMALYTNNGGTTEAQGYGVDDVNIMVAFASDGSVEAPDSESEVNSDEQLKSLADTLLKLQGFTLEEETESEDLTDLFLPKALQSHSRSAFHAGTSV